MGFHTVNLHRPTKMDVERGAVPQHGGDGRQRQHRAAARAEITGAPIITADSKRCHEHVPAAAGHWRNGHYLAPSVQSVAFLQKGRCGEKTAEVSFQVLMLRCLAEVRADGA